MYTQHSGSHALTRARARARTHTHTHTRTHTHTHTHIHTHTHATQVATQHTGEIDLADLRERLRRNAGRPAIVNVNIGTTVKGAVDDLDGVIAALKVRTWRHGARAWEHVRVLAHTRAEAHTHAHTHTHTHTHRHTHAHTRTHTHTHRHTHAHTHMC